MESLEQKESWEADIHVELISRLWNLLLVVREHSGKGIFFSINNARTIVYPHEKIQRQKELQSTLYTKLAPNGSVDLRKP